MSDDLEPTLRTIYGAYEYLRDNDLVAVSTTSRLLHQADLAFLARRIDDEITELRGAVAGTHGHGGGRDDIVLEAYQTVYWTFVLAVAAGDRYEDLQPHIVLTRLANDARTAASSAHDVADSRQRLELLRATLEVVGAECAAAGVSIATALQRDRDELRTKPYLAPYWENDNTASD